MLPSQYVCTGCRETFSFPFRAANYYLGSLPIGKQVADADLLMVPTRPAWCNDCGALCIVEDIAALRAFEDAYGCARTGQPVEYPIYTEGMKQALAVCEIERYLRWRMERRNPARALCCGGSNFQFMDVAQPLLRHAGCEFGVIEPNIFIGAYCGPGPGVYSPANIRVFDPDGDLLGLLTWRRREEDAWDVELLAYPPVND